MKTFRNQLLLKLTRFLSGQLSRLHVITWAREQMAIQVGPDRGDPTAMIVTEALSYLATFPRDDDPQYALVRASLCSFKDQLERQEAQARLRINSGND
jgi:hypothetical protein